MRRLRRLRTSRSEYQNALKELTQIFLTEVFPNNNVIDIHRHFELSKVALGEYVTLDWAHKREIDNLINIIQQYHSDYTKTRPLNIIMIAQPGLGKSHFVKCLAKKMIKLKVSEVSFNMVTMQNVEELSQPIEAIRNLKVVDKLPVLFLDEIDSDNKNYSRLLPLMWDGEIHLGRQDLKLGKVVLILAASDPSIEKIMKSAKSMEQEIRGIEEGQKKLVDFLSRVNGGVVEIPQLDIVTSTRDRRIDKICLTISFLQRKYPYLEVVPWALLRFIAISKFRYGVRSIVHLLDFIPGNLDIDDTLSLSYITLPLESVSALKKSSLSYHLIADEEPDDIIDTWNRISSCQTLIRFVEKEETEEK